ncbi:TPA: YSIRK-type signal peptide-containing protein, partial [Streptococcus suis]
MLDKKKIKFRRKRQVTPDKRYRYSIRKFNVGIASVAIAAFMFLGGGAVSVSASELESVVPANTITSLESGELAQPSPETPVGEEEVAETAPVSPAPSSEPAQSVPAPAPAPNSEPVQSVPAPVPAPSSEPAQSVPAPAPAPSSDSQELAATDDLAAAKKVLEQVLSEAEVLSADALRKAAKSTDDTSALQEAAKSTQAVIAVANKVFADENASLDDVNAQIAAIRTSVEALANQLYSSTASQDLSVMLTTGTPDTTTPAHYTKIINDVVDEPYAITARELGTTTPAVTSFNLAVYDAATGTSVYKRYDTNSPMNMTLILQDYKANASSFLTADAFKAAHPLGENETIYVVNKADLENAPAPTTLTFPGLHHREHIVYDPAKQQYYYFLAADVLKLHFEERGKNLLTANIYWKNLIAKHSGVAILKSDKLDPNLLISHTADKPTKHGLHDMGDIYDIEFETTPNFDDWKTTDAEGDLYANYGTNKTIKWRYVQKNQEGQVILREENWRETTVHVGYVNTRDKNDQTIYLSDTTNPDGYVEASKIISEQPYVDYTFTGRTPQNVYSDTQVTTKVVYNDFANYKANGMDFSKLPEPIRDELFKSELAVPGPRGTLPKDGEMVFDPYFKPRKSLEGYPANYLNAFNGEVIKYDGQGAGGNRDTTSDADNPKELDPTQTFPEQIYSERDYPFTEAIFGSKISIDDDGNLKAGTDPLTDTNVADYPLYDRYDSLYSPKYDTNNYWEYVIDSVPRTEIISDGAKINLAAIDAAVADVSGSVYADYIALDEQGNVTETKLQNTKTIVDKKPKDTDYALHDGDKKPETFEHNGRTYKLVYSTLKVKGTETPYSDTGKVVKGNINATHYYAPVQEKTIEKPLEATLRVEYYDDDTNLKFPQLPNGIVHKTGVVGKTYYKQSYYLDKEKREVALSEVKLYNEVTQGVAYDLVNDKVTDPAGITAGLNTTLNPDLTWEGMRNTGDPATSGENTLLYLYHSKITFEGVNTTKGEFYSDSVVKLYYSMDGDNPTGTTYDRTADDRGTLIIRYVDEEGNQLAEPYTHKDNLVVGTSSYKVNEVETAWDEGGSATAWAIAEDVRYDEVYVSKNIPYDVHRDQKTDGTAVKPDQIREYRFLRPEAKIPLSGSLLRGVDTITLVYTKTYQVRHRFEKATSVPAHIQLPTEIATRTNGKDYTDVASGDSRTPNDTIDKTAYVDNVNNGTWTFEAWDKSTVTVGKDNPNPEFVGTWLFTANTPSPASPTGSVKIVYKALTADGSAEDTNVTLRAEVNDTVDAAVGSQWNAKETNVDHDKDAATDPIDERPATLLTAATPDKASLQYKLVSEKTTIQKPTDTAPVLVTSDTELEGQVVEGLTTITYYYKPVLGGVIVKYVNEAGLEIADQYTDTDLNTHLTSPVQSYDATQTKPNSTDSEKPLTLTGKDGKSYIFKEVKTGDGLSQESGELKEGTTTVVYVYSEKPKGSVLVRYKALDAETGRQEDNSVTLRADYLDTPETYVDTAWSTVDKNVDHDNDPATDSIDEQPAKFENINGKDYVLVKTVTQVPGQDATSEATSGNVVEGQTVVTYFYAPVQTETATTENKGSVVIQYRRLGDKKEIASAKDDRRDVVVSTTTNTKTFYVVDGQRTYLEGGENGVDVTVPTAADQLLYKADETGEQPPTINFQDTDAGETAEKTYHFIKHDEASASITGSVEEELTKIVVYLYSLEQSETTSKANTAKVTVNYYILGTSTELQPSYEDTPVTKISETVSTRTYYLGADGNEVPVGDTTVVTNPVNPAVTYDTTETKNGKEERPTTLVSGDKTYHLVEAATSFTEGTGISGTLTKDTVVNYYYAEVKEEEVSRTPITGNVLVHYKRASDKQELKGTYTDTPATPVAYTVVTRSYYEDAQGQKHQVGDNRTSTETVSPIPTYTVEGTAEVPTTLPYENTTYHYIGLETGSKPLTGDVVEGTTEVTLLYTPELSETKTTSVTGSVLVRYKLEGSETDTTPDGITLRADYPDTTDVVVKNQTKTIYFYEDANGQPQTVREVTADPVPTNERYEITADEAPEILVSDGKQYRKVRRSGVAESGLVPEGTTTITYYYAPIQGGVIVKYVNEAGDEIADQYTDTDLTTHLTDPVQSYDADGKKADGQTDEKPGELVGKDGKTYVFKGVKSGDGLSQPSGNLKEGTTTVVYVYKEKDKGSVLVRYVALQEDNQTVDDTVHLADDYQDTPETYIGQDWNTTGNKTDGSLERPADFRNINGKDYLLVESKTTTTHDGQPVDNNPTSGQVQKGQTVVTYYYAPVPQGSVRIEYKALHPNGDINEDLNLRKAYFDTLNANVGTAYNASETGRVDHDDNPETPLEDEKPSQIILGATTYRLVEARTTKRLNDGQDSLTDLTSGQVEKGTITITYYYAPVLGQVIVKYKALNADGTAVDDSVHLADDYPEVTAGNVNDSYAITGQKPNSQEDEKPSTFVKPDKTYHLVASKTTKQVGTNPATIVGDNHDGNVAEGTTLITFFYAPEQVEKGTSRQVKGDVTIRYENTAGEEIKTSLPDTVQGLVATYTKPDRRYIKVDNQVRYLDSEAAETEVLSNLAYDADQTREDGTVEKLLIITHNDKNYHFIKLKDGSAATTGLVTEATQTVTYVYALEQTAVQEEDLTGSVVVKYQKLADRSQIKADYSDTTNVKVGVKRISQNYYEDKDGARQLVGNATEVKELLNPAPTYTVEGDTEKPAIIDVNGINYHFVGIDETKSALTGDVTEVTKEVVLLYNPEMVETTPNTRRASVYVDYKILGTNEELQARHTDTDQVVIATSETTKRYYLNQDGSETVLENTTSPETLVDVTYDTTENNERPLTLTKAGKEYYLVAGETVGETKGTLTADVYVTYYYAEIKTETGQTEEKGKVLIHYEDTEGNTISPEKVDVEDVLVSTAPTTRRYYEDGNGTKQYIEDLQVGTKVPTNAQYDASQVREGGVEEKPSTIIYNDKNYHFIKLKDNSAAEAGTVTVETQTVTYVYSPEVTVSTPSDNSAKVTVNYYILGTDTTLQPSYEDTPVTKISETVSTRTYYLGADGNEVPVGDPTVVTNPVNPAATYDTTETKNGKEERPTTLESGDKTYHLVEAATSFTEGTGISGALTKDTVVNYYYAEVKEEVTTVPTNGSVTIKYETTEGTPLREDKEDTASTVISTKTTTKKYYEYNGEKVYVGDPVESTETVDLSYDTTEEAKDEKPSTLEKDGKTYQRVAVKSGSASENGKVTGDHVVTYVYAEIKEEVTTVPTNGSVTIKYETTEGTPLREDKEDTASTVISTK